MLLLWQITLIVIQMNPLFALGGSLGAKGVHWKRCSICNSVNYKRSICAALLTGFAVCRKIITNF